MAFQKKASPESVERAPEADETDGASSAPHFRCVAIVGVGLIGGSLGMAIRQRRLADRVVGIDRDAAALAQAVGRGAIDTAQQEIAAVSGADCVIFATPVGILPDLMASAAPFIAAQAVVTDVGSVKRRIVAEGERLFGDRFVGGHPMAGSEEAGVGAARPDLFKGAPWILSSSWLDCATPVTALAAISRLVSAFGARVACLAPEEHDRAVALVSHLPHLLSFALARTVTSAPSGTTAIDVAGGSYRDMVRVSRSSTELWTDILLRNREMLLQALTEYEIVLTELRKALEAEDRSAVAGILAP